MGTSVNTVLYVPQETNVNLRYLDDSYNLDKSKELPAIVQAGPISSYKEPTRNTKTISQPIKEELPKKTNWLYLYYIIGGAFLLCVLLVYLLNQGKVEETTSNLNVTFGEVVYKYLGKYGRIIDSGYLNTGNIYSNTITSDAKVVIICDKEFMFWDESLVPREIIVRGNEFVKVVKVARPPYTFHIRALKNNTRFVLLFV